MNKHPQDGSFEPSFCRKLVFIALFDGYTGAGAPYLPPRGRCRREYSDRGGRGMRETQLDAVTCEDLLKSCPIGGLMARTAR